MLRQFLRYAPTAAATALALGCGSPAEPISELSSEIVGGTPTREDHGAVVYVAAEVRRFNDMPIVKVGSGTLVAPNLVVTALHVLSTNRSDVPFACDGNGNDLSGGNGSLLGPPAEPGGIEIYAGPAPDDEPIARGRQIVSSGSPTICQNDIAFVVLDRAVDLPTVRILRGDPVRLGAELTVVGFGEDERDRDRDRGSVVRSEREVRVSAVGQWIRTFTVTEGPCLGDSGGPALTRSGQLAGVFSTVAVECTGDDAAAKYTDVTYFESLVERAFDAASADPPWPTGEGGAANGEAGSGSFPSNSESDSGCAIRRDEIGGAAPFGSAAIAWALLGLVLRVRTRERR